jgi:hypothetical protein
MKILALLAAAALAAPLFADCTSVQWLEQSSVPESAIVSQMLAVDFDGDGNDDLVTHDDAAGTKNLYTRRSKGDGTFEEKVLLAPNSFYTFATTDLDGDGHPELFAVNGSTVEIFPGTGSGFSTERTFVGAGDNVRVFDLGNFDADPELELVTGGTALVYYDNVDGEFVERARTAVSFVVVDVAAGDFDGDGRVDIAAISTNPVLIHVYFRNAGATFTAPLVLPSGTQPHRAEAGDLDGDGKAELAVADWEEARIVLFRPTGSRQFHSTPFPLRKPNAATWGAGVKLRDVSGDGKLDLLGSTPNGHWLTTWINFGPNGNFLTPTFSDDAGPGAYAIGDFDGDEELNIVSAPPLGGLRFFTRSCAAQVYAYTRARLISSSDPADLRAVISGFPIFPSILLGDLGTVTFREGTTVLDVRDVDVHASARVTVPGFAAGEHTFTAEFSGNGFVPAATSAPFTQKVTDEQTSLQIITPGPSVHGTPWPVEIRIDDGQQEFVDIDVDGVHQSHFTGNNPLSLVLNAGPHVLRVFFEGSDFIPAAEKDLVFTTVKATPAMNVSGARTVRAGTAFSLQFTLTGPPDAAPPGGTVSLTEDGADLASVSLVNGVATINVTLTRGVHNVRATYEGNSGFEPVSKNLTLQVTPNFPLAIEARGIPGAIHIGYTLWPDIDPASLKLYRRVHGTTDWSWLSGWNRNNGLDATAAAGMAYEYRLDGQLTGGTPINSNMDTALRFTDDPLVAGMKIRHAHFKELRAAVNLLRLEASLSPFNFEATFDTLRIVRASHVNGLRTAVNEARAALGMSTISFTPVITTGSKIKAAEVSQVRDAAR